MPGERWRTPSGAEQPQAERPLWMAKTLSDFKFCPKSPVLLFFSTLQRHPPHPLNQVPL